MKRIIVAFIIVLFLVPFLSHSFRYFKQGVDEKKKVTLDQRKVARGVPKEQATPKLLKGSKEASAHRKKTKTINDFSNKKTAEVVKKTTEEIKPKEQRSDSNIHDEILSSRLNSKEHIKQIQTALKKAGFYKSEIDGKMGPRTKSAIKAFQKLKRLTPDGIVGTKTWEELNKYLKD